MSRKLRLAFVFSAHSPSPVLAAMNWPNTVTNYVMSMRKTVERTDMAGEEPERSVAARRARAGGIQGRPRAGRRQHCARPARIPHLNELGFPKKVDTNRKIYVQCLTGGRATLAAAALETIGFTNVVAVIMNLQDRARAGDPPVK